MKYKSKPYLELPGNLVCMNKKCDYEVEPDKFFKETKMKKDNYCCPSCEEDKWGKRK